MKIRPFEGRKHQFSPKTKYMKVPVFQKVFSYTGFHSLVFSFENTSFKKIRPFEGRKHQFPSFKRSNLHHRETFELLLRIPANCAYNAQMRVKTAGQKNCIHVTFSVDKEVVLIRNRIARAVIYRAFRLVETMHQT